MLSFTSQARRERRRRRFIQVAIWFGLLAFLLVGYRLYPDAFARPLGFLLYIFPVVIAILYLGLWVLRAIIRRY